MTLVQHRGGQGTAPQGHRPPASPLLGMDRKSRAKRPLRPWALQLLGGQGGGIRHVPSLVIWPDETCGQALTPCAGEDAGCPWGRQTPVTLGAGTAVSEWGPGHRGPGMPMHTWGHVALQASPVWVRRETRQGGRACQLLRRLKLGGSQPQQAPTREPV